MPMLPYSPTPTKLVTLMEADDSVELLSAATTNPSLEQLADAVAYCQARGYVESALWSYDNDALSEVWLFPTTSYAENTTHPNDWMLTLPSVSTGDIIIAEAAMYMNVGANVRGVVKFGVTHGGGTEYTAPGAVWLGPQAGGVDSSLTLQSRVVATATGSTRVRLLGKYAGGAGPTTLVGWGTLRATVFRPM